MEISIAPPVLFTLAGFPVTNTLFVSVLLSAVLLLLAFRLGRGLKPVPKGFQFWVEMTFELVYNFIYTLTKSERTTKKMFPLIMTLFLFILLGNLLAYIPGIGTITFRGTAIYRTITSDYSLVLMMTILSIGITQAVMIWTGGIWNYVKKFINLSGVWHQKPINFFLGIMDLIGEAAKVISLSFRLFGNMFAGEVLATVVGTLVPFVLPLPFALLGLLTTFVQPAVFTIFTTLNISGAIVAPKPAAKS